MMPLGCSGCGHDKVMLLMVALTWCMMGTVEGAAERGRDRVDEQTLNYTRSAVFQRQRGREMSLDISHQLSWIYRTSCGFCRTNGVWVPKERKGDNLGQENMCEGRDQSGQEEKRFDQNKRWLEKSQENSVGWESWRQAWRV